MRDLRLPPLANSFVVQAARLFYQCFSSSGNDVSSPSLASPPRPVVDNDIPYERYSDAVEQLRPLFPPNCISFGADEVEVVGDIPLGAGGYANIWVATLCGRSVIRKSYRRYENDDVESIFQRYCREVTVCSQLSHPNIVPFVGFVITSNHSFSLIFDTAGHLGLREYLEMHPQADKMDLVRGIACGLKHVHDLDVIHGRLCSQNVLVGPDGIPRIAGFGSSLMMSRPDLGSDEDVVGFHRGSAPELMRPPKPGKPVTRITKESDMYAFGMLTWEIFSGKDPFRGDLDATVVVRVLKGDRPPHPKNCNGLSRQVWNMVKVCWSDSPSRRMTVGEVLNLLDAACRPS
ncbi:kinase-like domain-containing protein [Thelephora terrestris]|uniref:Kinase-like domain-containing protein n=1 Tax=Thelephora terrestris TaxID=56493 RepID=A0A9P6L092_9AGAM|nr:kinase-like domain-containing protein [Thelephora terrestris]